MSTFTFDFNGQTFEVQGPPGATEAQARAVFEQQSRTGALVGLKSGDTLNSATQATAGLPAAAGQVAQALTGAPGLANGSLGSPYSASGKSFASLLSSNTNAAQDSLTSISKTLSTTPVTNGITTSDFAKQAAALVPMSGLSTIDVRAAVAQASAIAGQSSAAISDTAGVGKFGLNATQLESAGLLKTGTVATYLAGNTNTLTTVLKSPAVWTGKNGITDLDSLLNNPEVQSLTQQDLMSSGLSSLKQLGVPVNQLNTKALGGLSLNAAKSPADTLTGIQNKLPADAQAQFNIALKDGAFAIGIAQQKLNDAMTQTAPPGEAENTVDRATLDAAVTRVFGNDKIPSLDYGGSTPAPAALVGEYQQLKRLTADQQIKISELTTQNTTLQNVDALIAQYTAIRTRLVALLQKFQTLQKDIVGKPYTVFISEVERALTVVQDLIEEISNRYIPGLRQFKQRATV
jgi:hypothetical protein